MLLDSEGKAREICAGGKTHPEVYQTSIPTSAIRAGKLDCVHYMNIRDWGGPHGRWLTNFHHFTRLRMVEVLGNVVMKLLFSR